MVVLGGEKPLRFSFRVPSHFNTLLFFWYINLILKIDSNEIYWYDYLYSKFNFIIVKQTNSLRKYDLGGNLR